MKNDIAALTDQLTDVLNNFAGTAGKEARRGYKQARSNAESAMSEYADRGRDMVSDYADRGRDMISDFAGRGREMASAAQDAASSLEESLEDVVQERPLAALGIALGVGVLIGMAWRR